MSCIFDALQRSESERSGVECSAATELLRTAEKGDFMESESLPGCPCHACGRFVACNSLFCPNCGLFQGSVATEDSHNGESDSEPDPALRKRTGSWIYAFLRRKWIQIALAAGLTLSIVLFLTLSWERSVGPPTTTSLPDETVSPRRGAPPGPHEYRCERIAGNEGSYRHRGSGRGGSG